MRHLDHDRETRCEVELVESRMAVLLDKREVLRSDTALNLTQSAENNRSLQTHVGGVKRVDSGYAGMHQSIESGPVVPMQRVRHVSAEGQMARET